MQCWPRYIPDLTVDSPIVVSGIVRGTIPSVLSIVGADPSGKIVKMQFPVERNSLIPIKQVDIRITLL